MRCRTRTPQRAKKKKSKKTDDKGKEDKAGAYQSNDDSDSVPQMQVQGEGHIPIHTF